MQKNIKELQELADILQANQEHLAEKLGVRQATISRYMTGKVPIPRPMTLLISRLIQEHRTK